MLFRQRRASLLALTSMVAKENSHPYPSVISKTFTLLIFGQ
jgi:hypothetical protein